MAKQATTKTAYGDCEGPLGFPMQSAMAKEVEGILDKLPADCKELGYQRVVKISTPVEFREGERADVSLITTDSVDRDNEVMLPGGGDWKQFKKNPVVTFAHRYADLPVGVAEWLKREKGGERDGWLAKTRYSTRPDEWEGPWMADGVWHLVKSGELPGKSIGFIPTEVRSPTEKEIVARPELAGIDRVIAKWSALEYAVAPVQANPDALVQVAAKALSEGVTLSDELLDALGVVIPGMNMLPLYAGPKGEGGYFTVGRRHDGNRYVDTEPVTVQPVKLTGGDVEVITTAPNQAGITLGTCDLEGQETIVQPKTPEKVLTLEEAKVIIRQEMKKQLTTIDLRAAIQASIDQMRGRV